MHLNNKQYKQLQKKLRKVVKRLGKPNNIIPEYRCYYEGQRDILEGMLGTNKNRVEGFARKQHT